MESTSSKSLASPDCLASDTKRTADAEYLLGLVNKHRQDFSVSAMDVSFSFFVQGRKRMEVDSLDRRQPEGGGQTVWQLVA